MRTLQRALSCSFLAAVLVASLSPAVAQTAAAHRLAPADEYFGPLKMSVLGIQNVLRDEAVRLASSNPPEPGAAYAHANLVERSILDWEAKYPADHWLPRTVFGLQRLYARIPSPESRQHAAEIAAWLIARWPSSAEAARMRGEVGGLTDASRSTQ
jgi:hypothetical protein